MILLQNNSKINQVQISTGAGYTGGIETSEKHTVQCFPMMWKAMRKNSANLNEEKNSRPKKALTSLVMHSGLQLAKIEYFFNLSMEFNCNTQNKQLYLVRFVLVMNKSAEGLCQTHQHPYSLDQ